MPSYIASALVMTISGEIFDKIGAKVLDTIGIFILVVRTYKLACIIHVKKPIPISDEEYEY